MAVIASPPACNRVLPGSHHIKPAALPAAATASPPSDPGKVAKQWIGSFNKIVDSDISPGQSTLSHLFVDESYWRDLLCLSWDFHTLNGPTKIAQLIEEQKGCHVRKLTIDDSASHRRPTVCNIEPDGGLKGVQAFLNVETNIGSGRGIVKLIPSPGGNGTWKCFTLFTTLEQLTRHEESTHTRRPNGVNHGTHLDEKNWKERREAQMNYEDGSEPAVLIIGILSCLVWVIPETSVLKL